jgi:hypothetical protein
MCEISRKLLVSTNVLGWVSIIPLGKFGCQKFLILGRVIQRGCLSKKTVKVFKLHKFEFEFV